MRQKEPHVKAVLRRNLRTTSEIDILCVVDVSLAEQATPVVRKLRFAPRAAL